MKALFVAASFVVVAGLAAQVPSALAEAPAEAPAAQQPRPSYGAPITLDQAKKVVAAAEAEARRLGTNVSIAVVEPSGVLVMFERMVDATYTSVDGAPLKARSAAMWKRSTSTWIETMKTNAYPGTMPNVIASNGGEVIFSGGLIIGGIGISGSPFEGQIAKAAAAVLN
jgi:uncharacterized protein GlcG (DUF336 family)